MLLVGIAYPLGYDLIQMMKDRSAYFKDPWNYTDISFGFTGVVNIVFQKKYPSDHMACISTMTLVILLAGWKVGFYMRSFNALSPLVVLMQTVVADLTKFVFFYAVLIYHFDLMLGAIGYQNKFTDRYDGFADYQVRLKAENEGEYPGAEY